MTENEVTVTQADLDAVKAFAKEPHVVNYLTNTKLEGDWKNALAEAFAQHRTRSVGEGRGIREVELQNLLVAMLGQVKDEGGDMMSALHTACAVVIEDRQASPKTNDSVDAVREALETERRKAFLAAQVEENCSPEYCFDAGWDARAALQTQPAARDVVEEDSVTIPRWLAKDVLEYAQARAEWPPREPLIPIGAFNAMKEALSQPAGEGS